MGQGHATMNAKRCVDPHAIKTDGRL